MIKERIKIEDLNNAVFLEIVSTSLDGSPNRVFKHSLRGIAGIFKNYLDIEQIKSNCLSDLFKKQFIEPLGVGIFIFKAVKVGKTYNYELVSFEKNKKQ